MGDVAFYPWLTPRGLRATEIQSGDVTLAVAPDEEGRWIWLIGDEGADWFDLAALDDLERCIVLAREIAARGGID